MHRIANLRKIGTIYIGNGTSKHAAKRAGLCSSPAVDGSAKLAARRLEGKVAIVTGGASGIGEATCRLFAAHGAKVVIADIQDEAGGRVTEELGGAAEYRRCNVAREADVASLLDFALSQHGAVHILFNNAGIVGGQAGAFADLNMDEYASVMDVNVKGVVHGVKHAARVMKPGGSIICTASVNSIVALGNNHAYTIAKHAVAGIVKTAAYELGGLGIRVNAISPGVVPTPMVVEVFGRFVAGATAQQVAELAHRPDDVPLQGVGHLTAQDVADAALFLASEDSRFVSGHNLLLDGAFTCSRRLSAFAA